MRFRVFPPELLTEELVGQAYLSGIDRTAWLVRTSAEGGELVLERSSDDSGNLNAPWPVEGQGPLMLSTASLIERDEPYLLPLELARGTIAQVRNQHSEWQVIGLDAPPEAETKMALAIERFSRAVVVQNNEKASAGYAQAPGSSSKPSTPPRPRSAGATRKPPKAISPGPPATCRSNGARPTA
jgi:hypothetical protein